MTIPVAKGDLERAVPSTSRPSLDPADEKHSAFRRCDLALEPQYSTPPSLYAVIEVRYESAMTLFPTLAALNSNNDRKAALANVAVFSCFE